MKGRQVGEKQHSNDFYICVQKSLWTSATHTNTYTRIFIFGRRLKTLQPEMHIVKIFFSIWKEEEEGGEFMGAVDSSQENKMMTGHRGQRSHTHRKMARRRKTGERRRGRGWRRKVT